MNRIPGLKKVGAFWHYSIQVNGQRCHGSTKAKDLATARIVMDQKRRDLIYGQLDLKPKSHPPLNEIWETWWSTAQGSFSKHYLVSAECRYRRWIEPRIGTIRVDQIKTEAVLGVRAHQLRSGSSERYANNTLELIRTLVRFAIRLGHLEKMPFQVKPLRIQKRPHPVVPLIQVRQFLEAADQVAENPQVSVILWVLLGLGMREGEALGMRWEWFDLENQTYTVGKAKGKEARVLPVPDWLWSKLSSLPRYEAGWVFPALDGEPHHSGFCKKALKRICTQLGLGNVTQHCLRATFASLHSAIGTPLADIQGMLGHKSVTTTMIYVETSLGARKEAQEALSRTLSLPEISRITRQEVEGLGQRS